MASENKNDFAASAENLLEEAETLIWAMLDDNIDDAAMTRLSKMLEEHAEIRTRYIECVQLHVDLREHYGRKTVDQRAISSVLPNLMPGAADVAGLPQVQ